MKGFETHGGDVAGLVATKKEQHADAEGSDRLILAAAKVFSFGRGGGFPPPKKRRVAVAH